MEVCLVLEVLRHLQDQAENEVKQHKNVLEVVQSCWIFFLERPMFMDKQHLGALENHFNTVNYAFIMRFWRPIVELWRGLFFLAWMWIWQWSSELIPDAAKVAALRIIYLKNLGSAPDAFHGKPDPSSRRTQLKAFKFFGRSPIKSNSCDFLKGFSFP